MCFSNYANYNNIPNIEKGAARMYENNNGNTNVPRTVNNIGDTRNRKFMSLTNLNNFRSPENKVGFGMSTISKKSLNIDYIFPQQLIYIEKTASKELIKRFKSYKKIKAANKDNSTFFNQTMTKSLSQSSISSTKKKIAFVDIANNMLSLNSNFNNSIINTNNQNNLNTINSNTNTGNNQIINTNCIRKDTFVYPTCYAILYIKNNDF